MQKETKFKQRALADLRALGGSWVVKTQQVAIRGTPDIIGVVGGRFIALELKASAEAKLAPLQKYNIDQIRKAGGFAEVTWPAEWEATLARVKSLL
jgi:Holliday junction resolvase